MIDEINYVDHAEQVIKAVGGQITSTQLRKLLTSTVNIYNEVIVNAEEKLNADIKAKIEYLRVNFIYQASRDRGVKAFVDYKNNEILEIMRHSNETKSSFILFTRYMEALVAFHKYNNFN